MFLYDDRILPHHHYYLHGIVNLSELESSDKPNALACCDFQSTISDTPKDILTRYRYK